MIEKMRDNLIKWVLRVSVVAMFVYGFAIQLNGVEIIQTHPVRALIVGAVLAVLTTICLINELANQKTEE